MVAAMPDKESQGGRKIFRRWLLVRCGLVGLLLVGAWIAQSQVAQSQVAQSQVMVGVRGGINIANQEFTPPFFTGVRHGLVVGGHIQAPLDSTFSVVFQPQYAQKGVVIEGAAGALVTAKFNYLEFPLMLNASYRVRPLMVFAVAGINPGVLLSAASVKQYADSTVTIEAGAQTSTIDIAVDVGVGVGYQITNGATITGDIRYCFGLTDITVERGSSSTNSSRDLRIVAGALFRLGK